MDVAGLDTVPRRAARSASIRIRKFSNRRVLFLENLRQNNQLIYESG